MENDPQCRKEISVGLNGADKTNMDSDFNEEDYLAGRISVGLVSSRLLIQNPSKVDASNLVVAYPVENEQHRKLLGYNARGEILFRAHDLHIRGGDGKDAAKDAFSLSSTTNKSAYCKDKVRAQIEPEGRLINNKPSFGLQRDVESGRTKDPQPTNSREKICKKNTVQIKPNCDRTVSFEGNSLSVFKENSEVGQRTYTNAKEKLLRDDECLRGRAGVRVGKTQGPSFNSRQLIPTEVTRKEEQQIKADMKDPTVDDCQAATVNLKGQMNDFDNNDSEKVYNYLFYIGTRIPSKTFSKLCRSVNRQATPAPQAVGQE